MEHFDGFVISRLLDVRLGQVLVRGKKALVDFEHLFARLERFVELIRAVEDDRRAVVDLEGKGFERLRRPVSREALSGPSVDRRGASDRFEHPPEFRLEAKARLNSSFAGPWSL